MSQPMVMSLLHNTTPAGRVGEAIGVRMSLVNMSQIAMPLLFGALGTCWACSRCSGRRRSCFPSAACMRAAASRP